MNATRVRASVERLLLALAALLVASCGRESEGPRSRPATKSAASETAIPLAPPQRLAAREMGAGFEGFPWVTDLKIVDLDRDGLLDVVFCEGRLHQVVWLRQTPDGDFEERVLADEVRGPAHVQAVDLYGNGHLDLLIAGMGIISPSNEHIGSVTILRNDGSQNFEAIEVLSNVPRVTYVGAGDLNGNGQLDLSVGMFGYFEGEIRWLENLGDFEFRSHRLLGLEGTIHAPIADLNGNGHNDIVALVSQDWQEVYGFFNDGKGNFESRVLWGSTNKDFGCSGLTVADLNGDGHWDIVFTNGDGFDYATPGTRPWHGAQWLENNGRGEFVYHRIGDFSGSYSPLVIDFNGNGHLDVVVASGFNDWSDSSAVSLMLFENDGRQNFTPRPLAHTPTHLVVVDGADLTGDGRVELVAGSLHFHAPYESLSRVTLLQQAAE